MMRRHSGLPPRLSLQGGSTASSTGFETDLLRQTVRAFFRDELTPATVREYDAARRYPEAVWQRMGELGWLALPVS